MRKLLICFVTITWFIVSCKSDKKGHKEVLEVHSIVLLSDTVSAGQMTYKEIKYFDGSDHLYKQEFFDKEGSLKGVEHIDRNKKTKHSQYFSADSILLSYYNLVYEYDILKLKSAFDASNDQYLRGEQYTYDNNGKLKEKAIIDSQGIIDRVYKFAYDKHGNEIGFSVFDKNGELILLQTDKITKSDNNNRWTEKWGYRDNVPYTFSTREIIDI